MFPESRKLYLGMEKENIFQQASCTIMRSSYKWKVLADHWAIKLGIQTADRSKSFQSLPFFFTQLHFGHSSILYAKLECSVTHQNTSLLPPAHDCETGVMMEPRYGGVSLWRSLANVEPRYGGVSLMWSLAMVESRDGGASPWRSLADKDNRHGFPLKS